ncbi:hypothetical protein EV715DRAFT_297347 [Schizophyllum commune]
MPHTQSQPIQLGAGNNRKRRPSTSPPPDDDHPRSEKKRKTKAALFVQKLVRKHENQKKMRKPKEQSRTSHHLALQTHIRFIARLYEQNALPSAIDQATRDSYSREFKTADNVRLTVKTRLNAYASKIDSVHERVQAERNTLEAKRSQPLTQSEGYIVAWIAGISEFAMQTTYAMLAASGCTTWAPDLGVGSDPGSLYNLFHEDLALRSFRQAVLVGGYDHLGVNMEYAHKLSFLKKIYRSFVFHYLKEKVRMEQKKPGSNAQATEKNKIYKRRQDLARARTTFVGKMQGCPMWTQALCIENEAHSDDEMEVIDVAAPDGSNVKKTVYTIRKKEGRSDKVTGFFRMVDKSRAAQALARPRGKAERERREQEVEPFKTSQVTRMPTKVPIDYFSPQYWNETMTLRDRVVYLGSRKGHARVGLPKSEFCGTWAEISKWIHLSEEDFMAQYGNAVLADYAIPTDAQIAMIEKGEDEAPEESEEDEDSELEEFEEWEGPTGGQEDDNLEDQMSTGDDGQ